MLFSLSSCSGVVAVWAGMTVPRHAASEHFLHTPEWPTTHSVAGGTSLAAMGTGHLAPDDTVPNDTTVTVGTLPNGLRYYIRVNHKPEQRAELRLVVKAGSLMEDEDQRGGAHFVEHMAFRGTTHYTGTQLVESLKSIGVAFGSDLNANTNFEHTAYILPVPTDSLSHVKTGLQILEDWAHGVQFAQKDMDEERGIIFGELRSHLDADWRVQNKTLPLIYKGSRYPDRLPIGTTESLTKMTRESLVRFYKKWYRPDRMAVIAVGDFDKAQMEQMIRAQFSPLTNPAEPNPTVTYPIPSETGRQAIVVRDPEITGTDISVMYKGPMYPQNTVAAWRASTIRGWFDGLLGQRLQEITLKPDAPFIGAGGGHGDLENKASLVSLDISVPNNGEARGVAAVLTEVQRVAQHGFTATELERQKASALAGLENYYRNRAGRSSDEFVEEYLNNFLYGAAFPSAEEMVAIQRQLVPSITLDDLKQPLDFWAHEPSNRIVLITEPDNATVVPTDTTALFALFTAAHAQSTDAYVDRSNSDALVDPMPTPGKVVTVTQHPEVGVTEWTLSNGATVFLKPTEFEADQILFSGSKRGGSSLWADTDFPTAALGPQFVPVGGWGHLTVTDLQRRLNGKQVQVGTNIGAIDESVSGSSTKQDIETMFQMAYLELTQPRYDSLAMRAQLQQVRSQLANRSADPGSIFGDTVNVTMTQHSRRSPIVSEALLDSIDMKRAVELYKDRFADAGGFIFMFVGSFTPDSLRPLVEKYLASLPNLHRNEQPRDLPMFHPPAGVTKRAVVAGKEPRAVTVLQFTGPYSSTAQNSNDMQVMTDILQNRLENRLREQLGGTYGVQVGASRSPAPLNSYSITIQFVSDPPRREELTKATFAVIDSLKQSGPTEDELHRVITPALRSRERERKTNGYWLQLISMRRLGRPFGDVLTDTRLTSTTAAQVSAAATQYLDTTQYQEFDLLPAATGSAK